MKKLNLNLEKLRTLANSELRTVAGGVRMSNGEPCDLESTDCAPPATDSSPGHISGTRSFAMTNYC